MKKGPGIGKKKRGRTFILLTSRFILISIYKSAKKKNHPVSEVIVSLFAFRLLRDFTPLVKFYGNTEPVKVNRQDSDTNPMGAM